MAALELHPDFYRWRELRLALETNPEVICKNGEMTLRAIHRGEAVTIQRVLESRNRYFELGDAAEPPPTLMPGQRNAVESILRSHDFMSVLAGDAGTGKTTVLTAIEAAHLTKGGERFIPLAPTTRARDALVESGFDRADTVQRLPVSETMRADVARRVALVDEAGLMTAQQLDHPTGPARSSRPLDPRRRHEATPQRRTRGSAAEPDQTDQTHAYARRSGLELMDSLNQKICFS